MNKRWSLSEEIYRAFHRWPTLAGVILLGCLIGWFISFLMPPYFRSIAYIYVALNPYRTYSDANFQALARPKYSNIDDYKDWQMTQLESVIYLDEFILETKSRLDELNPNWQSYSVDDLRDMLEADWRSAGTWSLIGNSPDPVLAEQASSVWAEVVTERVETAIEAARQTFMIDQDLQATSKSIQEITLRRDDLANGNTQLEAWVKDLRQLDPNVPPDTKLRLQVLSQVSRLAEFSPAWMNLLENQPGEAALPGQYGSWIELVLVLIQQEVQANNQQILTLEHSKTELSKIYREKADASLGLSPNLEIESLEKGVSVSIRPTATYILIGGTTAFLVWILYQLGVITRKSVY